MKFRFSRYVWLIGALALGAAALVASSDVWGRTDQQSGAQPPGRSEGQRPGQSPGRRPQPDVLPAPPGEWWKDPEIKKEIRLTDAQSAKLEQIFRTREREIRPYWAELEKQLAQTNRLAAERTVTVEEFAVQVSRLHALNLKVSESRHVMLYRMSKELSDEQYKKLQEYRDRRISRGRGGQR